MERLFWGLSALILLTSCAHHRDVRPGAEGVHFVQVMSEDEKGGQRDALSQANHFCEKKFKKTAAIIKEQTKYTGSMDESTYKMGKTAGKVLRQGGNQAWVFGGKKEKNAGQTASGAGSVLSNAMGEGYTTKMKFKCI